MVDDCKIHHRRYTQRQCILILLHTFLSFHLCSFISLYLLFPILLSFIPEHPMHSQTDFPCSCDDWVLRIMRRNHGEDYELVDRWARLRFEEVSFLRDENYEDSPLGDLVPTPMSLGTASSYNHTVSEGRRIWGQEGSVEGVPEIG